MFFDKYDSRFIIQHTYIRDTKLKIVALSSAIDTTLSQQLHNNVELSNFYSSYLFGLITYNLILFIIYNLTPHYYYKIVVKLLYPKLYYNRSRLTENRTNDKC